MKTALVLGLLLAIGCSGEEEGGASTPVIGTWEGYVEAYTFRSGSDDVRFVFDAHDANSGAVSGSVVFGEGAPPPIAMNPDVGYPPGVDDFSLVTHRVFEGFAYPLSDASLDGTRFRASFDSNVVWADWCALQTSIITGETWGCLPNWGGTRTEGDCSQTNPDTDEVVAVDCGKFELCTTAMVCECNADGCSARLEDSVGSFDMALDGELADGTVAGVFGRHTVRLGREP